MTFIVSLTIFLNAATNGDVEKALKQSVEYKVEKMQEIIQFSDVKAEQIKQIELDYIFKVYKADKCFLCNKDKRIKRLKKEKDEALQNALERDEYIKYISLDNELIKNIPVHL